MSVRNTLERAVYRTYRAVLRRSQRPELPQHVPEHLALPEGRSPDRHRNAVTMPAAALVTTLVLSVGGALGSGVYIGSEVNDSGSEPPAAAIETQTASAEWRKANDVCLAQLEARENGNAGIFDAMRDADYQQCTAEREADVAQINAEADQ